MENILCSDPRLLLILKPANNYYIGVLIVKVKLVLLNYYQPITIYEPLFIYYYGNLVMYIPKKYLLQIFYVSNSSWQNGSHHIDIIIC